MDSSRGKPLWGDVHHPVTTSSVLSPKVNLTSFYREIRSISQRRFDWQLCPVGLRNGSSRVHKRTLDRFPKSLI
jgi:hypothetical protein